MLCIQGDVSSGPASTDLHGTVCLLCREGTQEIRSSHGNIWLGVHSSRHERQEVPI